MCVYKILEVKSPSFYSLMVVCQLFILDLHEQSCYGCFVSRTRRVLYLDSTDLNLNYSYVSNGIKIYYKYKIASCMPP